MKQLLWLQDTHLQIHSDSLVKSGIRLEKKSKNDQARVLTPKAAFEKGTNYIVLGRPIMNSKNPEKEILTILNSI